MKQDKLLLGALIIIFLALYTGVVFSFFATEGESREILLFFISLPLIVGLIAFPKAALIVLALVVYYVRWLYDSRILPREATWLIDILIGLLVVRTMFMRPFRHERLVPVELMIYSLIAFAGLSALVNGSDRVTFLLGMRTAFRYLLIFLAAYFLDVSDKWLKRYWLLLLITGLIQPMVVIIQYTQLDITDWDLLNGTFGFGQTPGIALFCLILFAYMAARTMEYGRLKLRYVAAVAWLSIAPFLGEAKMYFMFMPILILFMVRGGFLKRPLLSLGLTLVGVALVVVVDYVTVATGYWQAGKNPLTFIWKLPQAFQQDLEVAEYGRYDRGFWYVHATRLTAQSPRTVLFGSGPGVITESTITERRSPKREMFARYGLSSISTLSALWLLIEYGYFGVILFLVLIWMIYRRGRILRRSDNPEHRVMGRVLEAMAFTYGVWLFYQSAWQLDAMAFAFWPLAGLLVKQSYLEEARQRATAAEPAPAGTSPGRGVALPAAV